MWRSVFMVVWLAQALMIQARYLKSNAEEDGDQLFTEGGEEIFEGDMVLTQKQIDALYGDIDTRKAIDDIRSLWPKGHVPYRIGSSSKDDHHVIHKAIKHWMENTCINFEEISDKSYSKPHLIFRKNDGCHTHVGRNSDIAGQVVSIGHGCTKMGTVAHEVGHALGFYHEQSRPDRNNFVKIIEENIKESHLKNFQIHENIDAHGIPYDLSSVMHYGLDSFSKNKLNTMVPLDITQTFVIGQREHLSFLDIKLANKIYNCNGSGIHYRLHEQARDGCVAVTQNNLNYDGMRQETRTKFKAHCSSMPSCQNDGFVDKDCKCYCPPGFEGPYCEVQIQSEPELCGGTITEETTIHTPNYPNIYPEDISCVWEIQAPSKKHVRVHFDHFDLIYHDSSKHKCSWDILEVRNQKDLYAGEKYCGDELDGETLKSEGSKMYLLFKSEKGQNTGFTATVTFM